MGQQKNTQLKAYVRYDGNGRLIPGSLILQRFKPKVGNWQEIDANECCNYAPTTTTTSSSTSTTTSTSTSTSTSTTTTTIAMYYYTVEIYGSCSGGLLLTIDVFSTTPAVVDKWYTKTDEDLPIKVVSTASGGSTNYTSYFQQTPRDTCAA